jgi:hypothetical protein
MNMSTAYVAVAILALGIIAVLAFMARKERKENRLSLLAGLAFAFVLAGLFLGESRTLGYGLMGIGIILAVIDIFRKSRSK